MSWTQPVYDRTQTDILNRTTKAYMNYTDFIRIEDNCLALANITGVTIQEGSWWYYTSIPNETEMTRIRNNVLALAHWMDATYTISSISTNYTYFNELELALENVYRYIIEKTVTQPQCGFYYANEPNVLMAERN